MDCNKCVWGTRDGGCASWDCEFVDRDEAVKAWRKTEEANMQLSGKDATSDLIYRQAAVDALYNYWSDSSVDGDGYVIADKSEDVLRDLPSAEPEIIRCKDCKHKPHTSDKYDYDNGDCGFEIIFPDYRCPCRCDDEYYNRIPDDDWYCANAERSTDE